MSWRNGLKVASRTTVVQEEKIACTPGGSVKLIKTTDTERSAPPLTDEEAIFVARMALTSAASFGSPYDIEWSKDLSGHLWLLQARPITAFSVGICPELYSYAGFDSSCVLTLSLSAKGYSSMMASVLNLESTVPLTNVFYGKAYINSDLWQQFGTKAKKAHKATSLEELVSSQQDLINRMETQFETPVKDVSDALRAANQFNVASFTVGEATEYIESIVVSYIHYLNESSDDFKLELGPLVHGINYCGEASFSGEVLKHLAAFLPHLGDNSSVERAAKMSPEFRELWKRLIERFWFMSQRDEDISGLRWAHDDSVPFSLLLAYQRSQEKGAKTTFEEIDTRLSSPLRPVASRETDEYRSELEKCVLAIEARMTEHTDAHVSTFRRAVSSLRSVLHEKERIHIIYTKNGGVLRELIARACYDAGLVSDEHSLRETILPNHPIFSLEFNVLLNGFFANDAASMQQQLNDAQLYVSMFRLLSPPSCVGGGQAYQTPNEDLTALQNEEGNVLQGIGCSGGVFTGECCVATSLADAAKNLKKNQILVTAYTDPSWGPLFDLCGAIILTQGGSLAHAAVVAREMHIPAVVQVRNALTILAGKTVTIDGNRGSVTILD